MSKKKSTVALSAPESRRKLSANYTVREVPDDEINLSDIPELTEDQLRQFRTLSKKKRSLFK